MIATMTDMLLHTAILGGLVSVGALAILLLPWGEEDLAATASAVRRGWRWLDHRLRGERPARPLRLVSSHTARWTGEARTRGSMARRAA